MSYQALALVPEKTKDFIAAMEVLADVFGNPEKVLAVRMADLKKLGKCPPETLNGKWNYQAIVSFCLKVEVLVQDLLDLAEADGDEQLRNDVYSSAVRSSVQNLFSLKEIEKMRNSNKRGKEGLEEHLKFVKDFRAKAQTMVEPNLDVMVEPKRIENQSEDTTKRSFHHIFKKPRRFEDCRVCSTLDEEGIAGLFEDHLSDDVTGCPKFQAMTVEERKITCLKARICWKCCNKDIVFNTWHFKNCSVNKTHNLPNTCVKYPKCFMHAWLCTAHKDANKFKITEFTKKFKINPPMKTETAANKKPQFDLIDSAKPDDVAKVIKNMRRNARKRGAEVYDVPDGDSMFILAPLKGKTEPVLGFLDSGCSDAVFKQDVVSSQLQGVCINQGPICCTGVGGIKLQAKQEWIVKLRRKDGNYQLVQGLTLDDLCAPMPIVNTVKAVEELKNSDISNDALQNCCVPAIIGGEVGVILGIRYNNIRPKEVHSLESGLTIYSINLETHDPTHNAAIGGPHKSFTALLVEEKGGIQVRAGSHEEEEEEEECCGVLGSVVECVVACDGWSPQLQKVTSTPKKSPQP